MTLAIHGGDQVRRLPMPPRPPYGLGERNAANMVVASGNLSGFLAQPGEEFHGGEHVRALEEAWRTYFGVKYAVSMNSATSCLFAAIAALDLAPRDEVIVPPWSMSASVACVRAAGATPVFADIDPETYGLSAHSVAKAVTPHTKAIVIVDLFGCPPRDIDEIASYGFPIIEDAAQACGAIANVDDLAVFAGTVGDIGIFSLNRHKTIECGEGGIAVTNDDEMAGFLRGYRNHGEVINYRKGYVGGNLRMPENLAAIAKVQLDRLEELTEPRWKNAERLTEALSQLEGITPPCVPPDTRHVYYLYAVRVPGSAEKFAQALTAEGVPTSPYVEPLYRIPAFRGYARRDDSNDWEGWYPEVERAHREVVVIPHIHAGMQDFDIDDVIAAFQKVHAHRDEL